MFFRPCLFQSYLDSMSSGETSAPSAPAVKNYLDDMSSGAASAPTSGGGIASYLSALGNGNVLSGGPGIQSHVGSLASGGSQLSGTGMPSYLDAVGSAVSAAVSDVSAAAAAYGSPSVAGSPSTTIDTQVSSDGSQTTVTITSVTTVIIDDTA